MPYQTISCLVHIWHLEYGHQPKQNKTTNLPLLLQIWRLLFGSLTSTVSNFVVTLFYTSRNGDTPPWMLLSLSLTIQKVWIEHLFLSGISFEILFPLIFLWWHGSVSVKLNFLLLCFPWADVLNLTSIIDMEMRETCHILAAGLFICYAIALS